MPDLLRCNHCGHETVRVAMFQHLSKAHPDEIKLAEPIATQVFQKGTAGYKTKIIFMMTTFVKKLSCYGEFRQMQGKPDTIKPSRQLRERGIGSSYPNKVDGFCDEKIPKTCWECPKLKKPKQGEEEPEFVECTEGRTIRTVVAYTQAVCREDPTPVGPDHVQGQDITPPEAHPKPSEFAKKEEV